MNVNDLIARAVSVEPSYDIKALQDFHFDHRRYWRLTVVFLDVLQHLQERRPVDDVATNPVVALTASVLGDHHRGSVKTLIPVKADEGYRTDLIEDCQVDDPNLTSFYGNQLDGHFERYNY